MLPPALFWFRYDLRLSDNPALCAAAAAGPVVALYVHDDTLAWPAGGASLWWLHHSLAALARDLAKRGIPFILRKGSAARLVPEIAKQIGAEKIFWNRAYEPAILARDTALKAALKQNGHTVESLNGSLLFEPWEIKNGQGNPFRVFTPFSKACLQHRPPAPCAIPQNLAGAGAVSCASDDLAAWGLLPAKPDWAKGFARHWAIGEQAALERLHRFLDETVTGYAEKRDRPDIEGTSRLSPHLHFGEISPRQVFHAAMHMRERLPERGLHIDKFIAEILWREFSYHLLFSFPELPEKPLNPAYEHFPWQEDAKLFTAWCKGLTGIPIIDAGMRQLWQTGWMHNRVRMVTASFLVKNLLQPWQKGEAWFWDCLVDADLASNAASWQWVAGCGADAAPYYRVFNPVLQGQKFDPAGDYVRRFVPELAGLPPENIHTPWKTDAALLARAGVRLGGTYPAPIVDLKASRARALAAFQRIKQDREN